METRLRELSLFSGAGGGLLGSKLLGWRTIGYVEINDYCQRVIAQRIKDGILDKAPIFGDIRAFIRDGFASAYSGLVDVVSAGFPCQPFSEAGLRRGGDDERNMWPETIECIRVVKPRYAFLENVPGLLTHEYGRRIFRDLAECGLDARWRRLSGAELGAPHKRDRVWIVAYPKSERWPRLLPLDLEKCVKEVNSQDRESIALDTYGSDYKWNDPESYSESPFLGDDDGVANIVDRLEAAGNGQIPIVVKTAWEILSA